MKTTNFKLKAKEIDFDDTEFMNGLEKTKVLKDFVKFLNNHFKRTCFSKRLYNYLHLHCGFIAHYNIDGFYGEYFNAPMNFHRSASEYIGYAKASSKSKENLFVDMCMDLNSNSFDSTGGFKTTIEGNISYGNYKDLNYAMKCVFDEYHEKINELVYEYQQESEAKEAKAKEAKEAKEIKEVVEVTIQAKDLKEKVETSMVEKNTNKEKKISQTLLFDFL